MKNGDVFIDKFRDRSKGWTVFDEHKVKTADIKSMTIYNAQLDQRRGR